MRAYRKEKVSSVVHQIVGEAIAHRLNDPRVAPLTTVTRVAMTGDLLVARVYLSIPGNEATERLTLTAVRHASGYIQRMVARELPIRQCPELRFEIDAAVKGVRRTLELLAENRRREPESFEGVDDPHDMKERTDDAPDPGRDDSPESGGVEA